MQEPEIPPGATGSPDDGPRATSRVRHPPIAIVDRAGTAWWVTERDTRHDAGCVGDRCLIFSNESVVRRVWSYPVAWQQLSDEEFDALNRNQPAIPLPRSSTA